MSVAFPLFFIAPSFAQKGSGAVKAPPPNVYVNPIPAHSLPKSGRPKYVHIGENHALFLDYAGQSFIVDKQDLDKLSSGSVFFLVGPEEEEAVKGNEPFAPDKMGPLHLKWDGKKKAQRRTARRMEQPLPPGVEPSPGRFKIGTDTDFTLVDLRQPSGPLRQDMKQILRKGTEVAPLAIRFTTDGPYVAVMAKIAEGPLAGKGLPGYIKASTLLVLNADGSLRLFYPDPRLDRNYDKGITPQPPPKANKALPHLGAGS